MSALLLTCGGGGGGTAGSGNGGGSVPPPANESASGIWNGSFHSDVTNRSDNVSGVVTENNEMRFFSTTWGGQYEGNGTVSGNSVATEAPAFAPWDYVFVDGSQVGRANLTGSVKSKESISGTYSGMGDSGTFYVTYEPIYERPSSLSLLDGNWRHSSSQLGIVSLTISANGNITGYSSSGCTYSGNLRLVNSSYNAYQVSINISSCGTLNGNYNGHAILNDTTTKNDTFIAGVSNSSIAFAAYFIRQ